MKILKGNVTKILLVGLLIVLCRYSIAQDRHSPAYKIDQFYGAWISKEDDMLLIHDTTYTEWGSLTEINNHLTSMKISLLGDTLRFWKKIEQYNSMHQYDFVIIEKNASLMKLSPVSSQSANAFNNKDVIFTKRSLIEEPFRFDKITFIDSCRGHYNPCQLCFIQVNQEKDVLLRKVEENWNSNDEVKDNFYRGRLDARTFERMIYLISNIGINRYEFDTEYNRGSSLHLNSRSVRTYILEYNEKKVSFSIPISNSLLSELNWLFNQLCHEYELEEVDGFELKF